LTLFLDGAISSLSMMAVDNLGAPVPTTAGMRQMPPPQPPRSLSRSVSGYPERLLDLGRPPEQLWVRGDVPAAGQPVVAIVGARAASDASCRRAHALAVALGRQGVAIVSGGAFGIDAAAHQGALDAGAATFAVLGCGVDVVYPDRHDQLFAAIATQRELGGGLLSEYPPGFTARAGQFPARNRIIAALADVVIVIEAGWRSGALSTVAEARRLGRPVMATAGSPGTDRLLGRRSGAAVHEEAGVDSVRALLAGRPAQPRQLDLPVNASFVALLARLADAPDSAEGLALKLRLSQAEVMTQLGLAEIEGWIRRAPGGIYEVTRAH
jgi:DNA processing protein